MSRIEKAFSPRGHKALIPYLTVGYPSIEFTLEAVPLLAEKGCDIVELGIPFSDPLADGATIQRASFNALQRGVTPVDCLKVVEQLRSRVDIPLLFMTYYNPVFHFGLEAFSKSCSKAGVDGLILPDLPPEEGEELEAAAGRQGLSLVYLLAPTSTEERIEQVARRSQGFIYLVSLTGVTGARGRLPQDLDAFVTRVRRHTPKPLCVGFGISSSEQAQRVARVADGVIVGSRLIELAEGGNPLAAIGTFVTSMRAALDGTS